MTKEVEEKQGVRIDNTVSTSTELSQNTCEKNSSVKLDTNISYDMKEGESSNNTLRSEKYKKELDVDEGNLDSDKMGNGVENSTNDAVPGKSADEETEEEDVPGDFFDDFLKEDFMEGLDIVDDDAWEEDKIKKQMAMNENSKVMPENKLGKSKKRRQKSSSKIDHVQRFFESPPGEKKQKKKKHEEKSSEQKPRKGKEKIIDADEFDIRRDPEKTKRDIERDKARCEKDKEKKMISEKLSLVETGLVPPGMEMEIDIEEVKRQKEKIEQNKPPRDLREHLRSLRSRSKSKSRKQRSPKVKSATQKSQSPSRKSTPKRRRTRSPIRGRSPIRLSPLRRSPLKRNQVSTGVQRRSPLRRASPRRSPLRSPLRRSRERSYGEKRSIRRSRSHSPYYRSRRNRYSPVHRHRGRSNSRESEREIWLKRRRSRSRSPRGKREEKKSFLQEIAEKLNETRPQPINIIPPLGPQLQPQMHFVHGQPIQSAPVPVPAPAPVPPPANTYFPPQSQSQPPPQQQYDPYDQSFFIGTPQPVVPPNFVGQSQPPISSIGLPQTQIPLEPTSTPALTPQKPMTPTSVGTNTSRNINQNIRLENYMPISQGVKADSKIEIEKLFQDKKITLSEFLAITAKPEVASSSPAHLQEKIKVISRCQEAIKILGLNENKYSGKLVVHRTDNYKVLEQKNRSPLLRTPPVVFPFTQPQVKHEQKVTFSNFINQLLQKIGVMKDAIVDVDNEMASNASIPPTTQKFSPPPPPLIMLNRNASLNEPKTLVKPYSLGNNRLSKMVQTDVFKCESCEIRKKILYKTAAVQCGGDSATFSVSTQVTESDFYTKIPITQSLASLTPAQLLAKSRVALDNATSSSKFNRSGDIDERDILRGSFSRSTNNYNLTRYSPPSPSSHYNPQSRDELVPPTMFNNLNSLRSPFIGGGGRGRAPQSSSSRPLDPNSRFAYNNYY